ncbi:MAG: NAD+ synthase [bacterium]|nr:NAD+ synthase [bacterium]
MTDSTHDPARPAWAFAPAAAADRCTAFIRDALAAAGKERLVVGLSGGIDSAVAAGLAVRALGADRIQGLLLPYATSSEASRTDALAVAGALDLAAETVEITPMADAFLAAMPDADPVRCGNVMARCRMVVLYDRSAADDALVLGTGNRTEALLGYTTLHGDAACALNPLGHLYKTEVRLLARWLDLPEAVSTKAPSADLWEGQTDEDDLGVTYTEADEILHALVDDGLAPNQVSARGHDPALVARLAGRTAAMAFKRVAPPVAVFPGRRDPDAALSAGAAAAGEGFH